ncbi:UNVERIFIED_CONTAM: hypothetical protein HDU68_010474 [Siphonaria sp. JEL0065]|nr:hypothetical protein HDU68_010474 [Siphonaria sp. JEL0065]
MLNWSATTPCAIVIDALDELVDHEGVSLLLDAFQMLNKPIKLFVTSRPDVVVNAKGKKLYEIQVFDVESEANKKDIEIFTHDRLEELTDGLLDISSDEFDRMVDNLSEASNGLFIWITLVLGNVTGAEKFVVSEEETLEAMEEIFGEGVIEMKETGKQLLARLEQSARLDLNSLYCRALFKAYTTSQLVSEFKVAAGVILEAKVPLSADSVARFVSQYPENTRIAKVRVSKALRRLQSLLKTDKDDKLSFIHKTVREYLTHIGCHSSCDLNVQACANSTIHCCHNQAATVFSIDFDATSLNMANACLAILNGITPLKAPTESLFRNMAQLDGSIKFPTWSSSGTLSESLEYAVIYWSSHFTESFPKASQTAQQQLITSLHQFCRTKLPYYLEALLLLGKLNHIFYSTSLITSCLSNIAKTPATIFIKTILNDLKFVAFNFRLQLLTNPLQVFSHALIAVPQQTEYYQTYHHLAPVTMNIGAEKEWGPFTLHGHCSPVRSIALSPDDKVIVSGSRDSTVKLWAVETGECLMTFIGHGRAVSSVTLSLDGKTVVSGSWDKTIKVWDAETGDFRRTFEGHHGDVNSVCLSSDEGLVVSGSSDSTVRVWSVETGACLKKLEGHSRTVWSVDISRDGKMAASGSDDFLVKLWDLKSGACIKTLDIHVGAVFSVAFSPDAKTVVSGSFDRSIKLSSTQTGKCEKTLNGHGGVVYSAMFSSDGNTIVSGGFGGSVKLWSVHNGDCFKTLECHSAAVGSAVLSSDGQFTVSGSDDVTIKISAIKINGSMDSFSKEGHTDEIRALYLSANGSSLISGSKDKTVKRWSTSDGHCVQTFVGHSYTVFSAALSLDGQVIVSCSYDGTVKSWSRNTGECIHTFKGHSNGVLSVSLSTDASTIASASYDETVKLWSTATGECIHTLEGHTNGVLCVVFSPDDKTVASGSRDSTIKLWSVETGECIKTLETHCRRVHSVGYANNGKTLVSEHESEIKIWNLGTGECIQAFDSTEYPFESVLRGLSGTEQLSVRNEWILLGDKELVFNVPKLAKVVLSKNRLCWSEGSTLYGVVVGMN